MRFIIRKEILNRAIAKYAFLFFLILFLIFSYQFFDFNLINNIINDGPNEIQKSGKYSSLLIALSIFLLRSFSIIVPIIPGTYCAVYSGYQFGIETGLLIIFAADFFSCASSFFISRKLGRSYVSRLLGNKQMKIIEKISQNYLENNFFLMTGFLMTSWFDFVCYAVGLTKLSWKKFMPALVVSILISDLPFVAGGYTLSGLKGIGLKQIMNGEIQVLKGPYLLVLIISAVLIFGLGLLNIFIKNRSKIV